MLTVGDDNAVRLFELPAAALPAPAAAEVRDWRPTLRLSEGGTIFDYCWYSRMSSADPQLACLATTARDHPVHLWDAYTGRLRCSYRAYSHVDELVAALSIAFTPDGAHLYCGFDRGVLRIFDTARPGRDCRTVGGVVPSGAHRHSGATGQRGIVSCFAFSATGTGLFACGSYGRTISIRDTRVDDVLMLLYGHRGGVTQVRRSAERRIRHRPRPGHRARSLSR